MSDLIEALQILLKYTNEHNPTHCEHDTFMVIVDSSLVSEEDKARLYELSFVVNDYGFESFRFGAS